MNDLVWRYDLDPSYYTWTEPLQLLKPIMLYLGWVVTIYENENFKNEVQVINILA